MKISVAMTTYNGSKHIGEQLESILNQTRQPDEVIICDDRSTDNTVELISDFIKNNSLSEWRIEVNEKNLGWKQNFRKAISLTKGDIVFFADQDDIWLNDKINTMSSLMSKYNMGCLYGESIKVDGDGIELKERNSINRFNGKVKKIEYSKAFYTVGGLGCCMCVNRNVIDKYLQLDVSVDDHDSQCPRIAMLYDTLWSVNRAVIKYRIYEGNTSNISSDYSYGTSDIEHRINDIKSIIAWLNAVVKDSDLNDSCKKNVIGIRAFQKRRLRYLNGEGVNFFSLIKNREYYSGITMMIGDFAYRHKINLLLGKIRWQLEKIHL